MKLILYKLLILIEFNKKNINFLKIITNKFNESYKNYFHKSTFLIFFAYLYKYYGFYCLIF